MNKNKRIFLNDLYQVDASLEATTKTDAIRMLESPVGRAKLKVKIDATHSGVLTNLRVYPAIKVQDGYKSFFAKEDGGDAEYGAPILMHHDSHSDSIGRVYKANFSPLKQGEDFYNDFLNPDMPGRKGSGVVSLEGLISDQNAIQKILDGRYLSVSAGHSTNKMACSVCSDSIFYCEHMPGQYYNEEMEADPEGQFLCYGITDKMKYHEVSVVNIPAQPPAKITEFNWEEAKGNDNLEQTLVSFTEANKNSLSSLVLSDEDQEINLISGNVKSLKVKKSFVIPQTADKLKDIFSPDESKSKDDHPTNDRSCEADKVNVVEHKSNSNNLEDKNMTDTQKETVDKVIYDNLQTRFSDLESLLATERQKYTTLEQQVTEKDSEIASLKSKNDNLQSENESLQDEMRTNLATLVAGYRVRLNKPDAQSLDSNEKKEEYITKLSARSLDSLKDSVKDLELELSQLSVTNSTESDDSLTDMVSGDKVESPIQDKGDKPTPTKGKIAQSSLDTLFN